MIPFWILPQQVCVEAKDVEEAKKITEKETGIKVEEVKFLPYPGGKRVGTMSNCPSFCYTPSECAGRSSCPKRYACSE